MPPPFTGATAAAAADSGDRVRSFREKAPLNCGQPLILEQQGGAEGAWHVQAARHPHRQPNQVSAPLNTASESNKGLRAVITGLEIHIAEKRRFVNLFVQIRKGHQLAAQRTCTSTARPIGAKLLTVAGLTATHRQTSRGSSLDTATDTDSIGTPKGL